MHFLLPDLRRRSGSGFDREVAAAAARVPEITNSTSVLFEYSCDL
jgi:hypothetical protein